MIGDILQPTHLLLILAVALIVLGPKRLPEVGKSLGRGLRDFRSALSGDDHESHRESLQQTAVAAPDVTVAPEPVPEHEVTAQAQPTDESQSAAQPEPVQEPQPVTTGAQGEPSGRSE